MAAHLLYDVWEDPSKSYHRWKVQLIGYVAYFRSKAAAEKYVESVKQERKRLGLKEPS